MTSGQPNAETLMMKPASKGLSADAKLRGTAVKLAAAGRSCGVTTDITYDVRVGTSICDKALRASSKPIAVERFGAKGTSIKKTFDGRCVNTMVLMRPKRCEIGTARRKETAEEMRPQKKVDAAVVTERSKV